MQFKNIYYLNEVQKQKITRIIGVRNKKPYSYAEYSKDGYWKILESQYGAPIDADKILKKVQTLSDLKSLLEYYYDKGEVPYCPYSDILSDEQHRKQSIQNSKKDVLHRRHQFRKNVCLNGKVVNNRNLEEDDVLINDLSFDGINFSPIDLWDFYKGDTAYLEFRLNNKNRSKIETYVKIKHITHKKIGGEFVSRPRLDADLGFYIMFDVQ